MSFLYDSPGDPADSFSDHGYHEFFCQRCGGRMVVPLNRSEWGMREHAAEATYWRNRFSTLIGQINDTISFIDNATVTNVAYDMTRHLLLQLRSRIEDERGQ
jgi:hypothetical protein